VEEIKYILIGSFLIGLYLLYLVEKPQKPPKKTSKSEKPVIWHKLKK